MTNQPTQQYDPEVVTKTVLEPTNGLYGFQFPAGTSKEDKDFLIVQIAEAKRLGKHLEIDPRVKIIDLTKQPAPTPIPQAPVIPPLPVATPVPPVAPVVQTTVPTPNPTVTVAPVVVPPPAQTEQQK